MNGYDLWVGHEDVRMFQSSSQKLSGSSIRMTGIEIGAENRGKKSFANTADYLNLPITVTIRACRMFSSLLGILPFQSNLEE